jgi:hypothetical protein
MRTKDFIRELGPIPPVSDIRIHIARGIDPNIYLRASLAVSLRHFYKAADDNDHVTALRVIHRSCQLIQKIEMSRFLRSKAPKYARRRGGKRIIRGKNPFARESSRPSFYKSRELEPNVDSESSAVHRQF